MAPPAACPSANDLVVFVERGERVPGGEAIVAHLADCVHCREVLLALARAVAAGARRHGRGLSRLR